MFLRSGNESINQAVNDLEKGVYTKGLMLVLNRKQTRELHMFNVFKDGNGPQAAPARVTRERGIAFGVERTHS